MTAAGWALSWRVVLTREHGWPGSPTEVVTVYTVSQLREVVLRARADPSIARYRYWRHREWTGQDPVHDCGSGGYVPAGINDVACRCGDDHRVYRCHRCGRSETQPALGPGCGPIPVDPERRHR